MKKIIIFLTLTLSALSVCEAYAINCKKAASNFSMSYTEAKAIAANSECTVKARLLPRRWCNEGTGTWWISLRPYQVNPGCHPACVVDVATKTATINWMCTGLIKSGKMKNL